MQSQYWHERPTSNSEREPDKAARERKSSPASRAPYTETNMTKLRLTSQEVVESVDYRSDGANTRLYFHMVDTRTNGADTSSHHPAKRERERDRASQLDSFSIARRNIEFINTLQLYRRQGVIEKADLRHLECGFGE